MSLERKDLRLKLDHEVHARLGVLADVGGMELAELAEKIIAEEVGRRIHAATVIAERAHRLGVSGNGRD
jgi:hypothetical protein